MLASALSSKLAFSTVVASKTTKVTKKTARFDKAVASPARRSNRRRSYSVDLSN